MRSAQVFSELHCERGVPDLTCIFQNWADDEFVGRDQVCRTHTTLYQLTQHEYPLVSPANNMLSMSMSHSWSTLKVTPTHLAEVTWAMCSPLMLTELTWTSFFAEENTSSSVFWALSSMSLFLAHNAAQSTLACIPGEARSSKAVQLEVSCT